MQLSTGSGIYHTMLVWSFTLTLAAFGLFLAGCASGSVSTMATPEERFSRAKALFDNGNYLEAINEFTVLTLQYQGSSVAGDAQFYIGECRFNRGEFLIAAYEYSVTKRNYPASARVPEAQYKLAMSYYRLSPKSPLDQQYSKKAIDELQTFVEYYPAHPLATDADARIKELNGRLAKKQYETAILYAKMEYYKAAMLSYDVVIEKYHDTEYAPMAYFGKTEVLMGRGRYQDAATEIQKFLDRYPNSVRRGAQEIDRQGTGEVQDSPSRFRGPAQPGKRTAR
jgi:outer membrane protein assembly factor BamD